MDSGTLQYTGAGATTDRTFTLTANGGTIDGSGSGALVFTNTIPGLYTGTGNRTLTLTGTGTGNSLAQQLMDPSSGTTSVNVTGTSWALTNTNNTYTGATTITGAGTLFLTAGSTNNIAGSSSISVGTAAGSSAVLNVSGLVGGGITLATGQTLLGNGTVTGAGGVTANNSTVLSPGNSAVNSGVGKLTVGALNLGTGTTLNFDLASTSSYDTITDGGVLGLNGTGIGINLFQAGTVNKFTTDGTYTLITAASDAGGAPNTDLSVLNPATGLTYVFSFGAGTGAGTSNLLLTITGTAAQVSSWNNIGSGNYNNAGNWTSGIPNSAGATAIFGPNPTGITAPSTVTLDISPTLGEIDFNNANSYTITPTGGSSITLNNSGVNAILHDIAGSHTVNAPLTMTTGTTITVDTAGTILTLAGRGRRHRRHRHGHEDRRRHGGLDGLEQLRGRHDHHQRRCPDQQRHQPGHHRRRGLSQQQQRRGIDHDRSAELDYIVSHLLAFRCRPTTSSLTRA